MPTKNQPKPPLPSNLIQFSRLTSMTLEEQRVLYSAARAAAIDGNCQLMDSYLALGVPLYCMSRDIGRNGNREYARFLLEQNPQAKNLSTELAIGFKMKGDNEFVRKLIHIYGANPIIVKRSPTPVLPVMNRLSQPKQTCSRNEQHRNSMRTEISKPPKLPTPRHLSNVFFKVPVSKTCILVDSDQHDSLNNISVQ